jgi:hypothetical protein
MDVLLRDDGTPPFDPEEPLGGGGTIPGVGGTLPTVPAHAAWMKENLPTP